jgi:hypothetical protein
LTNPPQGAAIQFFGNDRAIFNGQAYLDSGAHSNAAIIFRTATTDQPLTERMRIDVQGRVKVGDVTSPHCIHVGDVCAGADLIADAIVRAGTVASANCLTLGDICAASDLVADNNVFAGSGCVKNSSGTVIAGSCPSDARLKQDIEPLSPVLTALTELEPVTFGWRTADFPDLHLGTERNFGLVAQQVESVMPHLVSEGQNGYKTVHYERLPIVMLQGMRDLKAENDVLSARAAAAEAENAAMGEQIQALESRLAAIEQLLRGGTLSLAAAR